MKPRLAVLLPLVAFGLLVASAGCGSPGSPASGEGLKSSPSTETAVPQIADGQGTPGASPAATTGQPGQPAAGKPIVYWVHTNW
ncbi:MAG: hypothetical protein DYG91_06615 [Chloroflexi bacterium CFX7]|nr:hypothetical protein [Chloroflexi bacterium CFX7]RIL03005.1 MAG: hypothetical protein DCC78_06060 [bacterium]